MAGLNMVKQVTTREVYEWSEATDAVWEFSPTVKPDNYNPDGIFLSNGPGDPSAVTEGIATAKALLKSDKPVFGICMGHQILGISLGAETFKLKFGHRGLNHPAGLTQQVEITSQNHGFAIDPDSLVPEVEITHLNLNDRTVAGLKHKTLPLFSVQYHPEASPGPHDADYLFDRFVQSMRDNQKVPA
ncbi:MAG: carbamoyl phosphate synthase small subunit, partial [Oscillatoriales cyanobacterium]